jgi:type I restriction enzyme S subunit
MNKKWPLLSLGQVTVNHDGRRIPVKETERTKGPYPYYGASGVVDYVDKYLFDGEFLLIAEDGENLRTRNTPVAFLGRGKFWVNNHAHIVEGNEIALTRYLLYAVLCADVSSYLTGSTMPKLTQGNLNRVPISIPPIEHQKAIVQVLGTLDDKIEVNRKMNQTLEAMARATFKSWFIDFDPVRAKMDGRWKKGQSLPGLRAELFDLFPERLEKRGDTEAPLGWETIAASEVIEFNPTESIPKGQSAPYLDMASLPTSGSWPEPWVYREFGSGMKFRNGDALLARITPCLENGKTAFIQCLPNQTVGWGSTEYIVMRARPPIAAPFTYLLARDPIFREHAIRSMTGTSGRQRAQVEMIASFHLTVPSSKSNLWQVFDRLNLSIFDKVKHSSEQNELLSKIRNTLLPKLISGELQINDPDKFLQSVPL